MQRFIVLCYFLNMLKNVHNKRWRGEGIFMARIKTIQEISYGKQNITGSFKIAIKDLLLYHIYQEY